MENLINKNMIPNTNQGGGNNESKEKSPFEINKDEIKNLISGNLKNQSEESVRGLLSVVEALSHKEEDLQPSGIRVLQLAKEKGIPAIMATAHHAIGGDQAGPMLCKYLSAAGIEDANTDFWIEGSDATRIYKAGVFWINKGSGYIKNQVMTHEGEVLPDRLNPGEYMTVERAHDRIPEKVASEVQKESDNENLIISGAYDLSSTQGWRFAYEALMSRLDPKRPYIWKRDDKNKDSARVLVVEDNQSNAIFAKEIFTQVGKAEGKDVSVKVVADLKSAYEEIEKGEYDAIVSDLYFPSETGSGSKEEGKAIFRDMLTTMTKDDSIADSILEMIS